MSRSSDRARERYPCAKCLYCKDRGDALTVDCEPPRPVLALSQLGKYQFEGNGNDWVSRVKVYGPFEVGAIKRHCDRFSPKAGGVTSHTVTPS